MHRNVNDMVVVITGASAGIGKALATELSRQGARLVLAARRLERLEELNRSLGGAHLCLQTDISRAEDCEKLVDAAEAHFGRIDTLVCNAGYGLARPFDQMSSADVRHIFDTNWFGTVECCRLAVPIMKQQKPRDGFRGQLMIVSSACARRGLPFFSTYAATKAAQLSLAEGLRVELRPLGIAVTSVHPVLAETDFFTTANQVSGMDPAALAPGVKQPVSRVAAKMVRAIEKPCHELWPKPMSRLSLNIAIAIPRIVDMVMSRMRDQVLANHHGNGKTGACAEAGEATRDMEESVGKLPHAG
ncbi:MAG: SDR family NAD(P)-dependent oxidoreductase [Planctomycetota bacterium]|nr:SDR family NAD(P)-dependent oxidoreductase [Planctomycetota bacterium]